MVEPALGGAEAEALSGRPAEPGYLGNDAGGGDASGLTGPGGATRPGVVSRRLKAERGRSRGRRAWWQRS